MLCLKPGNIQSHLGFLARDGGGVCLSSVYFSNKNNLIQTTFLYP